MRKIKEMWEKSYGEGTKFDLDYSKAVILFLCIYIIYTSILMFGFIITLVVIEIHNRIYNMVYVNKILKDLP